MPFSSLPHTSHNGFGHRIKILIGCHLSDNGRYRIGSHTTHRNDSNVMVDKLQQVGFFHQTVLKD